MRKHRAGATLCAVADEAFRGRPDHCGPDIRSARRPAAQAAASLITYVTDRPGHDRRYAIDCGKIQAELAYRAATARSGRVAGHV